MAVPAFTRAAHIAIALGWVVFHLCNVEATASIWRPRPSRIELEADGQIIPLRFAKMSDGAAWGRPPSCKGTSWECEIEWLMGVQMCPDDDALACGFRVGAWRRVVPAFAGPVRVSRCGSATVVVLVDGERTWSLELAAGYHRFRGPYDDAYFRAHEVPDGSLVSVAITGAPGTAVTFDGMGDFAVHLVQALPEPDPCPPGRTNS